MPIKKEVYICSYCKKKYAVKEQTILNHESWCYANPANTNECGRCKHYIKPEVEQSGSVVYGDDIYEFYSHYCKKRQLFMLSLKMKQKAKRDKNKYWTPVQPSDDDVRLDYKNKHTHIRCVMPKTCRYFK